MFKIKVTKKGKDPIKNTKNIKKAISFTLNEMAFQDGKKSAQILKADLTVRTPKFMVNPTLSKKTTSGFRLKTSRTSGNINNMYSEVGSVKRPRFTGWRENQYGEKQTTTRLPTAVARGNSNKSVVKRSLRQDKIESSPSDKDYGSGHKGSIVMLRKLQREKYKGTFVVTNHKKMKPGAYKFKGRSRKNRLRQVQMIQAYKQNPKKTKRNNWKQKAHKANNNATIKREFKKNFKRFSK